MTWGRPITEASVLTVTLLIGAASGSHTSAQPVSVPSACPNTRKRWADCCGVEMPLNPTWQSFTICDLYGKRQAVDRVHGTTSWSCYLILGGAACDEVAAGNSVRRYQRAVNDCCRTHPVHGRPSDRGFDRPLNLTPADCGSALPPSKTFSTKECIWPHTKAQSCTSLSWARLHKSLPGICGHTSPSEGLDLVNGLDSATRMAAFDVESCRLAFLNNLLACSSPGDARAIESVSFTCCIPRSYHCFRYQKTRQRLLRYNPG